MLITYDLVAGSLRRREGVRRLPAVAVRAVPSFWRGGELVAAPHLGVEHASVGATFVHGRRADGKSALFGPVAAA